MPRRYPSTEPCSIPGCSKTVRNRGLCNGHYLRWYRHGDPLAGGTSPGEALRWLEQAVAVPADGCIDWPFADDDGYGRVKYQGTTRLASHVALLLAGREPPVPPLEVRHLCGRPKCINTPHLVVGTSAENSADQVVHGTRLRGEQVGVAKLTEAEVLAIRASAEPARVLAARYGIAQSHVYKLLAGDRWGHLTL